MAILSPKWGGVVVEIRITINEKFTRSTRVNRQLGVRGCCLKMLDVVMPDVILVLG